MIASLKFVENNAAMCICCQREIPERDQYFSRLSHDVIAKIDKGLPDAEYERAQYRSLPAFAQIDLSGDWAVRIEDGRPHPLRVRASHLAGVLHGKMGRQSIFRI